MYQGMVDLGSTLVGAMLVVDGSDTPINADALPTYRVYGPSGFIESGTTAQKDAGLITDATNASPIVITSAAHGLTTGARVTIIEVLDNFAANGTWIITKVDADRFSLNGSSGDGGYTANGKWNVTGLYEFTINALGASEYEKGGIYHVNFVYAVSSVQKGQVASFQVS